MDEIEKTQPLPIYERARQMLIRLGPLAARIATQDRDLAAQLRRAAASVLPNLAEGAGSSRGTRRARYESTLGSARETLAALHVAQAWAYLQPSDDVVMDGLEPKIDVFGCAARAL